MDIQGEKGKANIHVSGGAVAAYSIVYLMLYFLSTAIWLYAVYLSFKCSKGFSFTSFLLAFCCSPCYIAYRYAVKC